jgi:hypothetical protein
MEEFEILCWNFDGGTEIIQSEFYDTLAVIWPKFERETYRIYLLGLHNV